MTSLAATLYQDMMRAWDRATTYRTPADVQPPEPEPCPWAGYAGPTRAMRAGCPFAPECPDARRPADGAAKGGGPA